MSSKTAVCNMALAHVGVSRYLSDVDSDTDMEATVCLRFIENVRKQTLREHTWPFATKVVTLGLLQEDPNDEWGYEYAYPSDCLYARRVLSGIRTDDRQSQVSYRIIRGEERI